jgi:Uma2 family endonuclease
MPHMATAIKKLTTADYEKMPADGFRHEIIDGEEFMTPPPTTDHQSILFKIARRLGDHAETRKLGRIFVAPTAVVFSNHDAVEPDVFFVSKARLSIITPKNIQGAPDLVVEVLSPSPAANDRGPKLRKYEEGGVREYWIVDPMTKTVEIREFAATQRTRTYQDDQSFQSECFPGLTVGLQDIFSSE